MIAFSLDSQEMSFLKDSLLVTDSTYGIIVSAAGIGAIVGELCAAAFVKKISLLSYIGAGFTLTMGSYLLFYFEDISAIF